MNEQETLTRQRRPGQMWLACVQCFAWATYEEPRSEDSAVFEMDHRPSSLVMDDGPNFGLVDQLYLGEPLEMA